MEENKQYKAYYELQKELRNRVVHTDVLPKEIKYIAGTDVAYNDTDNSMIGAVVILNAASLEVIETAHHEMETTFPYVPGLFSFREIPALLEAFKKLKIQPDLIVCDAQGIAHPYGLGMATHLGLELDIPTIGCAKKRLIGEYDKSKLPTERGATQSLTFEGKEICAALRTQDDIKPMFVSIGHKISLKTALDWVLKLCPKYRLPETTRQADQLVNRLRSESVIKKASSS
jgi:deoxyribonuclease V